MRKTSRNRWVAASVIGVLSATVVVFWASGASAEEEPGADAHQHSKAVEGDVPGVARMISSLDDLNGLPCNTTSDDPGTVQIDYGVPQSESQVGIYCQVGDPKLTISIDTESFATNPDTGLRTSGGRVTADPPGFVCDSADLPAGARSCEPVEYQEGDVVTLTVEPDAVSSFAGWVEIAGTCQGTQSPCSFVMGRDERVSATFGLIGGL